MPVLKKRPDARSLAAKQAKANAPKRGVVRGSATEVIVVDADTPLITEPVMVKGIDDLSLAELREVMDFIPKNEKERKLYKDAMEYAEEVIARRSIADAFTWLTYGTKSKDEQADPGVDPFREFPHAQFIRDMLTAIDREDALGIWKSRTVMGTWTVAGYCEHLCCTRPATRVVFQSNDEDRALKMVEYCKILWQNSVERLRARWKLTKAIEHQSKGTFEHDNASSIIGIAGYPEKIKSEHPTIYVHDEAAISEKLDACLAEAAGAHAKKIILISSSKLGHMNDLWEVCREVDWYEDDKHRGIAPIVEEDQKIIALKTGPNSMSFKRKGELTRDDRKSQVVSRDAKGVVQLEPTINIRTTSVNKSSSGVTLHKAGAHDYTFIRVHYQQNNLATPETMHKLRRKMRSEAQWQQEMEINPRATAGSLVYPEFSRELHVVNPNQIPKRMTIFCSIDPHPRTPHFTLWLGVDKYGDYWAFRELWPSIAYSNMRKVHDDEEENMFAIWQYAETIAKFEGNELEFSYRYDGNDRKGNRTHGRYVRKDTGERVVRRYMDQAGKSFTASSEDEKTETFADRYRRFGISCLDPKKSHEAGQDAVRDALKLRKHSLAGMSSRLKVSSDCEELIVEFENLRFAKSQDSLDKEDQNQKTSQFRCHGLDNLRYILASAAPFYREDLASDVCVAGLKAAVRVNRAA